MRKLPGDLPAWLSMGRLFGVAHALGNVASATGWASLLSIGAVPHALDGTIVPLLGLLVGTLVPLAIVAGTGVLVARAKTVSRALVSSMGGTAGTFVMLTVGRIVNDLVNTQAEVMTLGGVQRIIVWNSINSGDFAIVLISALLGGFVGAMLARPAIWAIQSRGTRAGSSGRALFGIGAWLIVPAAIAIGGAGLASARNDVSWFAVAALASAVLAVLGAIVGALLLFRRSRWIAKVRRGEVPGFRIRVATQEHTSLPRLDNVRVADDQVLEEVVATDDDPYRAAQIAQPIARVD